jgi:hypothetical protein
MIFQLSFVKLVGRELTNLWVHSVLLVKHYLVYVAVQHPFEETSRESCFGMILGHHSWGQLLVISHKYNFRWVELQSDKSL